MSRRYDPATPKPAPEKPAADPAFDSVARLLHLGRVADSHAASARDLQARRNDLSSEIAEKRRDQIRFTELPNIDPTRYVAVGAEITALEAQRDQLDQAQRLAANAATDALRLHESCSLFAHQNGLPRPSIHSSAAALPAGSFQ